MGRIRTFYGSMVGKKVVMGVTGVIGIGFVILHSLGNLLIFQGSTALNAYSHFLKSSAELLWALRTVLIVAVVLHVIAAVQLTRQSRAARPTGYVKHESQVSTLASRTMRWGGVLLLIFIVVHILHFTTRKIDPAGWNGQTDAAGRVDVYGNIVNSFRIWWVSAFYIISMIALGLHLFHGAWASVRTLGYAKPSDDPLKRRIALGVALIVWAGFTAVPLGVLLGILR